jgi:hypothetical protein
MVAWIMSSKMNQEEHWLSEDGAHEGRNQHGGSSHNRVFEKRKANLPRMGPMRGETSMEATIITALLKRGKPTYQGWGP